MHVTHGSVGRRSAMRAVCGLIVSCAVAACGGGGGGSSATSAWQRWVNGLADEGYDVAQGGTFLLTGEQCAVFEQVFGSCFGNNPASPYVIPQPPDGAGYVDPYYATTFAGTGPDGDPTNIFFRVSDHDAIVTLLTLPPRAAYLGYVGYVFSSETSNYSHALPTQMLTPDPDRFEIFGSLGKTINNIVIENQSGAAWNGETVMLITTANRALADALIASAAASGLDTDLVFPEAIGSNAITGLGKTADDFIILIRYAIPEDQGDGEAWVNAYTKNALVYRVSNTAVAVNRYGPPVYTSKAASDESALQASVDELVDLLSGWLTSVSGETAESMAMTLTAHVDQAGKPTVHWSAPIASPPAPAVSATIRTSTRIASAC